MQSTKICFDKVKKDCFRFIKSQETSKEKFSNKEGMLKSFLIPMCFWIVKKANNKKPYSCWSCWRTRNRQNHY